MGRTRLLVPQVCQWRWACCAEAAQYGVGLPCHQRNFFSDRNAALIVGLGKALVSVPRCSQQTHAYRVVCVIRRVNASTTERAAGHTSVPVHAMKSLCDQDGCLYAHINFFIPHTSKRAASGPVPRSSHLQLKIHRAIYTAGLNS